MWELWRQPIRSDCVVNAAFFNQPKSKLNEWVLIAPIIKISGVIEINGVVKELLNITMGAKLPVSQIQKPKNFYQKLRFFQPWKLLCLTPTPEKLNDKVFAELQFRAMGCKKLRAVL